MSEDCAAAVEKCWLCHVETEVWWPHSYARGGRIWICERCAPYLMPVVNYVGCDKSGWPLRDAPEATA